MSSAQPLPDWTRAPERGSVPLVRFMARTSAAMGRRWSRLLLFPITLYFFCTAARARASIRAYLSRCLGREPGTADLFRLFSAFSTTIHDRVFFLGKRFDLFDIELQGAELLDERATLLMGAHLGSFEALRACGRRLDGRRVAMVMYEENARRLNAILAAIEPSAASDIIALGRADSMLALHASLDAGDFVGVLADRRLGDEPAIRIPFFGEEAAFPIGPMRMAAALELKVVFMAGLYRGANRYEMRFEPLADFIGASQLGHAERRRRVEEAVRAYAKRLEDCCRSAPDNWFNFHDFWADGA